ncbi:MAG: carboxypeptidase-like regulatory domain-containing protein, partial [Bryobacteraceae bacterium]
MRLSSSTFPMLAFSLLAPALLTAQSKTTADLSGTVRDASEALVPDTKITVTNPETGLVRETRSDAEGHYRVVLLPPGTYEIRAEKQGFSTQNIRGIGLTVGQTATINVLLAVGPSTQIVDITTETPLIESERAQQANTIGQLEVRN